MASMFQEQQSETLFELLQLHSQDLVLNDESRISTSSQVKAMITGLQSIGNVAHRSESEMIALS